MLSEVQVCRRVKTFILSLLLLTANLLIAPLQGFACSQPRNESYFADYNGSCGSEVWELQAGWGPDLVWDEGSYTEAGYCNGGYYNCSCNWINQSILYPDAGPGAYDPSLEYADDGWGGYDIDFEVFNWNAPTYTECSPDNCPGGVGVVEHTSYWTDYVGYDDITCF